MRRIAVLDAPSNLGLRPPTATSVPGCAKAPGALRDHGLLTRLGARDAGCLTPPRYDAGDWRPGDGVAHAQQIAAYSRRLADRIGTILDAGEFPVILGGDCSILLGSGLAMHRLGEAIDGRIGLVFVDGHSDFRHPGNASYVGAAAGEDLALVTGRGQADLASIEGRRPYFRDIDVVVLGIRAQDEYRLDLQAAGIITRPVPALRAEGAARSAQWARDQLADCAGYWVHVDVDVLDPAVMPAVDAPSPGGIAFPELELLLAGLVESPHCLGVEITVFDPDYDPDGEYAAEITSTVTAGLAPAKTVALRPDLAAARRDLDRSPDRENTEAAREHRRAEAARQSVSLAAAAASGDSRTPETPLSATILLAVEDAADLPAERPLPTAALDAAGSRSADDPFSAAGLRSAEETSRGVGLRTAEETSSGAASRSADDPVSAGGLRSAEGNAGPIPPSGSPGVKESAGSFPAASSSGAEDDTDRLPDAEPDGNAPLGDAERDSKLALHRPDEATAEAASLDSDPVELTPTEGELAAEPSDEATVAVADAVTDITVRETTDEAEKGSEGEAIGKSAGRLGSETTDEAGDGSDDEAVIEVEGRSGSEATGEAADGSLGEAIGQSVDRLGSETTDEVGDGSDGEAIVEVEDRSDSEAGHSDEGDGVAGEPEAAADAPGRAETPHEEPPSRGRRSRLAPRNGSTDSEEPGARMLPRPLGSAPLLDSEPLPATRPGMLRPRRAEPSDEGSAPASPHASDGFSLPIQRPRRAFDAGSDEPADIV